MVLPLGFANTLALIPHPAAKAASVVLGAGAVVAGGVAGSMAYNAVSGGIDWAKQQASPEGLDNVERRTGAYRHTSGKSADELRQMYYSYAKSLEIIEVQKKELEAEFKDNRHLEEYTRKLDSLETAAAKLITQQQNLTVVMEKTAVALNKPQAEQMLSEVSATITTLEARLVSLQAPAPLQVFRSWDTSKMLPITLMELDFQGAFDRALSLVEPKRGLSFGPRVAEQFRKDLQDALEGLDPLKMTKQDFLASVTPVDNVQLSGVVKDAREFQAVLALAYDLLKARREIEAELEGALRNKVALQGQLNQDIKTEAELQDMILGKDAGKGIDRVKKTTGGIP